ncbi:hypothetical protein EXIGLDRAFT_754172 [Exidia glandulosa HHB12029]|uniref:HECT domain-containing protein n=1 Tax=Exidia glandulosa HHB12029 TaxID=1314781 RepID=A0A165D5T9_EXIGL|nr:hypothetical protein EXIGLDRAFT_754172 [Exidia glandulosa HHB12029]
MIVCTGVADESGEAGACLCQRYLEILLLQSAIDGNGPPGDGLCGGCEHPKVSHIDAKGGCVACESACKMFSKSPDRADEGFRSMCVCGHRYFVHHELGTGGVAAATGQIQASAPGTSAAAQGQRIVSFEETMAPVAPAVNGGRQEHYSRSGVSRAVPNYRLAAVTIPPQVPPSGSKSRQKDKYVAWTVADAGLTPANCAWQIHLTHDKFDKFPSNLPPMTLAFNSLPAVITAAERYNLTFTLAVSKTGNTVQVQADIEQGLAEYFHQNDLSIADADVVGTVEPPVQPHAKDWVVVELTKKRLQQAWELAVSNTPFARMDSAFLKRVGGKVKNPRVEGQPLLVLGPLPRRNDLPPVVVQALRPNETHQCFAWRALYDLVGAGSEATQTPPENLCQQRQPRIAITLRTWETGQQADAMVVDDEENDPPRPPEENDPPRPPEENDPPRPPEVIDVDLLDDDHDDDPARPPAGDPAGPPVDDQAQATAAPETPATVSHDLYSTPESIKYRRERLASCREKLLRILAAVPRLRPFALCGSEERETYGPLIEKLFLKMINSRTPLREETFDNVLTVKQGSWTGLLVSYAFDWKCGQSNGPGVERAFRSDAVDHILSRDTHWQRVGGYSVPVEDTTGCDAARYAQFRAYGAVFGWSLARGWVLPTISPFFILALLWEDPLIISDLALVKLLDPELYPVVKLWPSAHSIPMPSRTKDSSKAMDFFQYQLASLNKTVEVLNARTEEEHRRFTLVFFSESLLRTNLSRPRPPEWAAFKEGLSLPFGPDADTLAKLLTGDNPDPKKPDDFKALVCALTGRAPTLETFKRGLRAKGSTGRADDEEFKARTVQLILRYLAGNGHPKVQMPDGKMTDRETIIAKIASTPELGSLRDEPDLLRRRLFALSCFSMPYFPSPSHHIDLRFSRVNVEQLNPKQTQRGEKSKAYKARLKKYTEFVEKCGCPWTFHTCTGVIDIPVGEHLVGLIEDGWANKDEAADSQFDFFLHDMIANTRLFEFSIV